MSRARMSQQCGPVCQTRLTPMCACARRVAACRLGCRITRSSDRRSVSRVAGETAARARSAPDVERTNRKDEPMKPYDVTAWSATSALCDYCEEGAEYGAHRHAFYVSREGASLHTADELVSLFASDVLDIYADRGHDDDDATFWQMKATADELATAL